MLLLLWGVVFVVSLFVLIKAADYFTDAAEKVGLSLGLPLFIIGVTIVAVGTSLPELVAGVVAVLEGASEIVAGNAVGSNITNILLVLGVAIVIGGKMRFDFRVPRIDLFFLLGATFLLMATVWDGVFTLLEAGLCLTGIVAYLGRVILQARRDLSATGGVALATPMGFDWKSFGLLVVSALFIYLGAKYTVEAIIELAGALDIGKEIIALSAVALGTSLPELAVAVAALRKNMPEIVVGNVLGSNIFNALAVMGVPALIAPLVVPSTVLAFGLPLMLASTLLFLFFIVRRKKVARWQGALMLVGYIAFISGVVGLEVL